MAAVTAPVAGYSGEVAGVQFVNGKAETDDDNALAYFRRHGYDVDGSKPKRASTRRSADDAPDVD